MSWAPPQHCAVPPSQCSVRSLNLSRPFFQPMLLRMMGCLAEPPS